jgi:hypothetical protein
MRASTIRVIYFFCLVTYCKLLLKLKNLCLNIEYKSNIFIVV